MLLNYSAENKTKENVKGMNGKMMVFGWTIGGLAMLTAMYAVMMLMQFGGSFKL
ncbi:hypothetical protein JW865_00335 [Candidatus Bathyarchaeota archaeon]|nr:hypothetical protein [Candidatus Bathyarchaeota archaeon]